MLDFDERPWLAPYVEHNLQRRLHALTKFQNFFSKLLSNALYGKTLENPRHYSDVRLVNDPEVLTKLIRKPTFRSITAVAPAPQAPGQREHQQQRRGHQPPDRQQLALVTLRKPVLRLNKPVFAGAAVLDISKAHMARFHYGAWQPQFGQRSRLLFTDTDSLAYEVRTPAGQDAYTQLAPLLPELDTSGYPTAHPLHSAQNKSVAGKMKDEMVTKAALAGPQAPPQPCLAIMTEFAGLRAKMYAFSTQLCLPEPAPGPTALVPAGVPLQGEVKRAKGLLKSLLSRQLALEDYRALATLPLAALQPAPGAAPPSTDMRHTYVAIRSIRHVLQTVRLRRRTLSAFDDKRNVLPCGRHTLAHGHHAIAAHPDRTPPCPFCLRQQPPQQEQPRA